MLGDGFRREGSNPLSPTTFAASYCAGLVVSAPLKMAEERHNERTDHVPHARGAGILEESSAALVADVRRRFTASDLRWPLLDRLVILGGREVVVRGGEQLHLVLDHPKLEKDAVVALVELGLRGDCGWFGLGVS